MIKKINIQNYKSIVNLDLSLGRFNVLIGANGCGKSNILEAITMASASESDKLEHEYFANRGIRLTEPRLMLPAFESVKSDTISVKVFDEDGPDSLYSIRYNQAAKPPRWEEVSLPTRNLLKKISIKDINHPIELHDAVVEIVHEYRSSKIKLSNILALKKKDGQAFLVTTNPVMDSFMVYSLEESMLRQSDDNSRINPLGRRGEGLLAYIKNLAQREDGIKILQEINDSLSVFDWFEHLDVPSNQLSNEFDIKLSDAYISESITSFDQRSTNEGFLYLLFYLTLIISDETPRFFAIENIDASFNPKLCREVIKKLIELARKHNKQIIATTHNPAVLDGLNLDDEDVALSVVRRTVEGYTKTNKVTLKGKLDIPLSEAWMRGYIGGLPDNF